MTKRLFAGLVLATLCAGGLGFPLRAQMPDSVWVKTHGGQDNDRGKAVVATADGGFAVAGEFGSYLSGGAPRNGDMWLVRLDEQGDLVWSNTFGGPGIDEGNAIRQTRDGGFVLAGARSNALGIYDAYLVRTDAQGDTLWTKTYGARIGEEWAGDVEQTSDEGFVFTGWMYSQATLSRDVWLVRTDADGKTVWAREFGGGGIEMGFGVRQTGDGGFVVVGSARETGKEFDLVLIRTDENGEEIWTRRFNGQESFDSVDQGRGVIPEPDGGFYVLGESGGGTWLLRTDANGDAVWSRTLPEPGRSFFQAADGGFVITGITTLLRTDGEGETLWVRPMGGYVNGSAETADGGILAIGSTYGGPSEDLFAFRLGSETPTSADHSSLLPAPSGLLDAYPNPSEHGTTVTFSLADPAAVELSVYDALGRRVRELSAGTTSAGRHELFWDGRSESGQRAGAGIYMVRLTVDGMPRPVKTIVMLR